MSELTHIDEHGKARMVDVSGKEATRRVARAQAVVTMRPETLDKIRQNELAKGDALAVARVAGVLAAKRVDELIPLCHSLPLAEVSVEFEFAPGQLIIQTQAVTVAQTGVEMEALAAATVAALTVYDMAKAVDKRMVDRGRPSGIQDGREEWGLSMGDVIRVGVLTVSDRCSRGEQEDQSGPAIQAALPTEGFVTALYAVVPDDKKVISDTLRRWCDDYSCDVILTTGGTGFSPSDVTPEATQKVLDRDAPNLSQFLLFESLKRSPFAALSRGAAGVRGRDGDRQPARQSVRRAGGD